MCFFTLAEYASLRQKEPLTTLKHISCRKYSFEKLTEFPQGNNVVDAVASNIDCFLWRDTCVSSTQPNMPNRSKQCLFPPRNTKVAGTIHLKN
jgi:hypothetical protein